MNSKIYVIIIMAIIVTTLFQTFSFIGDDHRFYQTVQDKCTKCHGDIKIQLSTSAKHSSYSCTGCHPKSATNHTNKNPECEYCHTTSLLDDPFEAHRDFVPLHSEGCIACHTTFNVMVNYSRPEYIEYDITDDGGNWIISNFATTGTLNLSYNAFRQGGNHNIKNTSCRDCHRDIFDAVSVNGHAVVLGKDGKQVLNHSTNNLTSLEAWCLTCHNPNDTILLTQQHSARRTTCEGCHEAYNLSPHPGNLFTNIKTVPHLYRSLVCTSCKSTGWQVPNATIHFKVHQEPYFDVWAW